MAYSYIDDLSLQHSKQIRTCERVKGIQKAAPKQVVIESIKCAISQSQIVQLWCVKTMENWLVVSTPLKNMSSSIGMMKFRIYGKIQNWWQPNHPPWKTSSSRHYGTQASGSSPGGVETYGKSSETIWDHVGPVTWKQRHSTWWSWPHNVTWWARGKTPLKNIWLRQLRDDESNPIYIYIIWENKKMMYI